MLINKKDNKPLLRMFRAVPPSYDMLNRLLTLGFDERWRSKTADICLEGNPVKVMDLCCGTGDLAIHLSKRAPSGTRITALDFSDTMLDLARKKAARKNIDIISFINEDVGSMPFADGYFDAVGIAFAFRNLTFRNAGCDRFLMEIIRVIKPGGRFVIVETSQPSNRVLQKLFHWYMRFVTVPVGGLISRHYGAYKYLAHSAIHYHNPGEVKELLLGAGFTSVRSRLLLGGIASIYTAVK